MYTDPAYIKSNFPYIDEKQKNEFSRMRRKAEKSYIAPRCTDLFQCPGVCNESTNRKVEQKLKEMGISKIEFKKFDGFCLLLADPPNIDWDKVVSNLHGMRIEKS